MSKWVIGKYIRLSDADRDLMKKEGKTESESVSHQKALIQNFVNEKDVFIDRILIYDPKHIEIQWKLPDEVIKFIEG